MVQTAIQTPSAQKYAEKNPLCGEKILLPLNFTSYISSKQKVSTAYLVLTCNGGNYATNQ